VVQEPTNIPWIYQFCHLIASSSLFCCFSNVNQPSFLSTQSVRHNTCQAWQCNYVSQFIESWCINQALHCYHQGEVLRNWTVSAPMNHFTLTPASCKRYSIIPHTCFDPKAWSGMLADLTTHKCILWVYGNETSQIKFLTRTGY